ncbi:MAG: hypothetical protein PHU26_04650 [Methanofollis liminatans]|jgi:hypothetical protein|nr:hypothetical protein [Methanofollis liminatans]
MKERFTVLWRRTGRSPCPYRSSDTDRSLPDLLREIVPLLKENGVLVEVTVETVDEGAGVWFNGAPLADLIDEAAGAQRYCTGPSRMEELGRPECAYEEEVRSGYVVPEIIFRKAVLLALED